MKIQAEAIQVSLALHFHIYTISCIVSILHPVVHLLWLMNLHR